MPDEQRSASISVFFPAYNDAASIASLVETALAVLPMVADDYEVIIVNDGSTDATQAVLEELARAHPRVRVIQHARNMGYGAALRNGFKHARMDLIFYTDGDGQYDVRELVALRALLTARVDVVNGLKIKRADKHYRRFMGEIGAGNIGT